MKKIFSLYALLIFVLLPAFCLAQEEPPKQENKAEVSEKKAEEEQRVKFAPTNRRDPFLSKDEVAMIEKNRRAEMERIEKERKAKEDALIAARKAEEERIKREQYLKENPHLAVMSKIKIQGVMGDEAQINNDFKGVGDKVAGATITKITDNKIYFKYKNKSFSMSIPKSGY